MDRFVIVSIFIPKLRLILILNSFLGSSDSLVFSELFHSLAPRPLAARSEERRVGKECRAECSAYYYQYVEPHRKYLRHQVLFGIWFFFSSRRRHTISVSAFLLNRSSDLCEHFHPEVAAHSDSEQLLGK